jgi:plastocyanin
MEICMRSGPTFLVATSLALVAVLSACSGTGTPSTSPSPTASPIPSTSADALAITGVEYEYQGVPASAKVGTVVTFTNGGHELHELIAVRRNDGVTTPVEDLISMPQEESDKLVTISPVVAIAAPGESAPEQVTLDRPGSYIFICFIPQGMTSIPSGSPDASAAPPPGAPHFTLGMVAELTVIE